MEGAASYFSNLCLNYYINLLYWQNLVNSLQLVKPEEAATDTEPTVDENIPQPNSDVEATCDSPERTIDELLSSAGISEKEIEDVAYLNNIPGIDTTPYLCK